MEVSTQGVDIEMTSIDGASGQNENQHIPPQRFVSFGRGRSVVSQHPCEDEIVLLEDVDIDVAIPPKLTCLDFPKAEEGREEDVAKVIRKSFSKLGLRSATQDALTALAESGLTLAHVSWQSQIERAVEHQDDQFWEKVASKSQSLGVGMMEAIFEVYTDIIIEETGSPDKALLWILKQDYKEFCTELFVIRLIESQASVFTASSDRNTPLHLAALKGYVGIGKKLLEAGALHMAVNGDGYTPLELAIQHAHNEFAAMIIKRMEAPRVRQLFQCGGVLQKKSKLSLHTLLEMPSMKETVFAVLDTLVEHLDGHKDTFIIHYAILDSDQNGRPPNDTKFDKSTKSCLHKIAKSNNKDVVYHDVVRLLLRRKWKKFARYFFFLQFIYFLMLMATLTAALVLAAKKRDPRVYDRPEDVFRGICEGLTFLMVAYNGISEFNQLRIHRLLYFRDPYNYLDMPAIIFTFVIIPLRAVGLNTQWVFASLCYLFNGLRAFKYAAVFRSTGAYVQILFQVLLRDMIQFGAIFAVFLFSFSGAFYLALRGEVMNTSIDNNTVTVNMTDNDTNITSFGEMKFTTNLELYPFETAEIYNVWFTGLRVMIEGGVIVEQYFGPQGFMWLGVLIYLLFLFLTIVVLLNLLIAQMSDTYSSVQQDAQRSLAINRAWIVARVEHNSMLARDMRKWFYRSCEVIEKPQDVLEKWEVPPINEVSRNLEKLERTLRKQEETIEEIRTSVLEKLTEQGRMIDKLVSTLTDQQNRCQSSEL